MSGSGEPTGLPASGTYGEVLLRAGEARIGVSTRRAMRAGAEDAEKTDGGRIKMGVGVTALGPAAGLTVCLVNRGKRPQLSRACEWNMYGSSSDGKNSDVGVPPDAAPSGDVTPPGLTGALVSPPPLPPPRN